MRKEEDIKVVMQEMFEEGETPEAVARELEIPIKVVYDIYTEWKQMKMDKLNEGDKVCYVLNLKGYDSLLVHGNILTKKVNSVIVESEENAYVSDKLNGRVAVSVKDILKVG